MKKMNWFHNLTDEGKAKYIASLKYPERSKYKLPKKNNIETVADNIKLSEPEDLIPFIRDKEIFNDKNEEVLNQTFDGAFERLGINKEAFEELEKGLKIKLSETSDNALETIRDLDIKIKDFAENNQELIKKSVGGLKTSAKITGKVIGTTYNAIDKVSSEVFDVTTYLSSKAFSSDLGRFLFSALFMKVLFWLAKKGF